MIFKPDLASKVLSGEKTQTRRPLKYRYEAGRTYAVQPGRGKRAVGRIRVLSVDEVDVTAIDDTDAHAEGFKSRNEFLDLWRSMYGTVSGRCQRLVFEVAS